METPAGLLDLLKSPKRLAITSHERPDGDALGSSVALAELLERAGHEVRILGLQPIPPRYGFLIRPGQLQAPADGWSAEADALIVLDCGAFDRPGKFTEEARGATPVVNIDHHDSNTMFGDLNWVEPGASCTGELVHELARSASWSLPLRAAEAIWVAIVTDTGKFSYSNTRAHTLRVAAGLIEAGVEPLAIDEKICQSIPLKEYRLLERALASLELHLGGRVASVSLREEDFRALDCGPENGQEVVNIARNLAGVSVGLFFYELPDRRAVKLSVRTSAPYDALALCGGFGGGGHHRAAGCSLAMPLEAATALALERVRQLWFGGG